MKLVKQYQINQIALSYTHLQHNSFRKHWNTDNFPLDEKKSKYILLSSVGDKLNDNTIHENI